MWGRASRTKSLFRNRFSICRSNKLGSCRTWNPSCKELLQTLSAVSKRRRTCRSKQSWMIALLSTMNWKRSWWTSIRRWTRKEQQHQICTCSLKVQSSLNNRWVSSSSRASWHRRTKASWSNRYTASLVSMLERMVVGPMDRPTWITQLHLHTWTSTNQLSL